MIRGCTFDHQNVRSKNDGGLYKYLMSDGIIRGCSLTVASTSLSIQPGLFILAGRIFQVDGATSAEIADPIEDGYGQLVLTINLASVTAETYEPDLSWIYSTTTAFPELSKGDINGDEYIYQAEVAIVRIAGGNIISIESQIGISKNILNGDGTVDASLALKQTAYTSLGQIGLTIDTASSYAAVHNAMPENSTLTISWTGATSGYGAFGQLMPADYGTCVIRKNQVSSWTFYKYDTGIIYSGTYTAINNAGWTGWKNCTIQLPTQTMQFDMGGCASTSSSFRAYGPVAVTKYGTWARIDFAINLGNISWTGVDTANYFTYGIPLATLRSLTGLPLNYANDILIPGQAFFKVEDATVNGGICGGFQVKGGFLCPGRWYFENSTYKFGAWPASGPCNVNGAIWSGTINVGT